MHNLAGCHGNQILEIRKKYIQKTFSSGTIKGQILTLYKYKPPSDNVQRKRTVSPPTFLTELCPFSPGA